VLRRCARLTPLLLAQFHQHQISTNDCLTPKIFQLKYIHFTRYLKSLKIGGLFGILFEVVVLFILWWSLIIVTSYNSAPRSVCLCVALVANKRVHCLLPVHLNTVFNLPQRFPIIPYRSCWHTTPNNFIITGDINITSIMNLTSSA